MRLKKIKYFYPEKPTLMMIQSQAFKDMSKDPVYIAEPKFNESRCELHLLNGKVEFWDRHGKHLKYNSDILHEDGRNEIIEIIKNAFGVIGYFVLDCGLRHNKVKGVQNKLVIYDIHVFKSELLKSTFKERREILEKFFQSQNETDIVHLINQYPTNFKKVFNHYSKGDEFEGIVIKDLTGRLSLSRTSNKDSLWMFKVRKQTGRHRY